MFSKNVSRYRRNLYLIKWYPINFLFFKLGACNRDVYFVKIPVSVLYFTTVFVF